MPGVMPLTDATPSDIPCWQDAFHCRFDPNTGRLKKIGGWERNVFDFNETIRGIIRTVWSATINQRIYTILGTNTNLYSVLGSRLANITPFQTTSINIPNSLSTHYGSLANNPIETTLGSNTIAITDTEADLFKPGDVYTLSGAVSVNGIPAIEINGPKIVRTVGPNIITVYVSTSANASSSGGGGGIFRSSGLVTVQATANGLFNGDRIKIEGATGFGGITADQINQEFIIRNVSTNAFNIMTSGTATSSVSAAGGSGTSYYPPIPSGNENQLVGQGYGAGLYGMGLYGTALVSRSGTQYPRVWFVDRFGDNIVMTPGNQTGVYTWAGDDTVAPTLISNAPTEINYAFVQNNILVTFGYQAENKIFASDQGDYTQWTASANNQVFEDIIEGAGRFISHVPVDGYSLIFTENQTYTFKYIGLLSGVWQITQLDAAIGIISPMARVSVNGYAYWMGQDNFYMFRGNKVEIIPSNFGAQSSILRYVFDDLNYSQRYKIFAYYNEQYDEIWFFYPTSGSNNPNKIARYSRKLNCWVPDELERTAAEYPTQNLSNPRLANESLLYTHEVGWDDDGQPMVFHAKTKRYYMGTENILAAQVLLDVKTEVEGLSQSEVSYIWTTYSYLYPMFTAAQADIKAYHVLGTTNEITLPIVGRYLEHKIRGEQLGQSFFMGSCMLAIQLSSRAP